jgi:hypothetical protein
MIKGDPIPSNPHDPELIAACKNLYDVMAQPFESRFTSFGYSLEFSATPAPDSIVHLPAGPREMLESELGLSLDKTKDWRVMFQHDEQSDGLRADTVEIPFLDSSDKHQSIVFKRFPKRGYLLLQPGADGSMEIWLPEDQELEKAVYGKCENIAVSDQVMSVLLDEAGFKMEVPNMPESRYDIAKNLNDIPNWTRRERIVAPIAPDFQVILVKEMRYVTEGSLIDHGGSITAYSEDIYKDGGRGQLVITLPIDGAFVETPEILTRKIIPSTDVADIANYGPNAYKIIELERIPLTTELADQLSQDLMEDLGDIA